AALADIKKNLLRRNPLISVKEFPSLVQGADAPKELLKALKMAKESEIDVLIIGRGGGASEDLNAFNDETLVREAAKFPVPIISAVGHEIDFTLIDYVADARASTPTGAAELATIDKREIYENLRNSSINLDEEMIQIINNLRNKLELAKANSFFVNPKNMYENTLTNVKNTKQRIDNAIKHLLEMRMQKIASLAKELKSISVDSTIQRGFSITETNDGRIIKDIKDVELNQLVKTRLHGGVLTAKVVNKEAN
ncbi:MAG: exodeoxyribonuclease VII large subunit, partial [Bacilli bacterium]|nr:exodeoxyribonuclease VII large subunit [Bacilli bacterium]